MTRCKKPACCAIWQPRLAVVVVARGGGDSQESTEDLYVDRFCGGEQAKTLMIFNGDSQESTDMYRVCRLERVNSCAMLKSKRMLGGGGCEGVQLGMLVVVDVSGKLVPTGGKGEFRVGDIGEQAGAQSRNAAHEHAFNHAVERC